MFERIPTQLPDVIVLQPRIFRDARGFFAETYRADQFEEFGIRDHFVQHNHSNSCKNTVRGMHYQLRRPQAKLCRVVHGAVLDVAVDIRRGSPTFGRAASALLTADNMRQIYIPIGFAHGFVVLSTEADFLYQCSEFYDPEGAYGVLWSDPTFGIDWRVNEPVISEKDRHYPLLADIPPELLPRYESA
jgi:dTDP-4-dehydrorhamnose 3,5-epimerase